MVDDMKVSLDPALLAGMSTREENERKLRDMVERSRKVEEFKGIGQRSAEEDWTYPYLHHSSKKRYASLDEVINHKTYRGRFPQSFSPTASYFLENGISPYFEDYEIVDYSPGVFTIDTMIELTSTGRRWALDRPQDIYEIIYIVEQYQELLKRTIQDGTNSMESITRKAYFEKTEKFLLAMRKARDRYERSTGKNVDKGTVENVIQKFLSIFK